MERAKLQSEKRQVLGRKVKKLRKEGILPANLYGKNVKSISLQILAEDFQKVYKEAGETGLIDLKIGSETKPVLIHNLQLDPVTGDPLHIDFHQVSLTEKTKATVPIELKGESAAIEQKIGVLIQPISEIEVEALPADLPDKIAVDITKLVQVDDAITIGDLQIDKKKVEIKVDPAEIVIKIGPLEKEEVVPSPPTAEKAVVGEEGASAETVKGAPAQEAPKEDMSQAGEEKKPEEK